METSLFSRDQAAPEVTGAVIIARMTGRPSKPLHHPPNRIKEVREGRHPKITQEWIAARCGVTGETVRKWETGEAAISIFQLERVARAMGVPAHTLLNDYIPLREDAAALLEALDRLTQQDRDQAVSFLAWLESQGKARARS